jgi:DNA invertase Pin-like site-specific DNA recombinase
VENKKAVALYARVSTVNHHQNPELQLVPMREWCKQRERIEYVDRGISGTKARRPELDRLLADAKKGLFSTVLVWKFDRMARSTMHLHKVLEEFKALGIDFVSLTEQVDTSTPGGKLVFTILGAVAEMERELIVERITAGLARSKKKLGGWRPKRLDGKPRGFRKPLPPNPEHVAQAHRLRDKGLSLRSIGEEMKRSHTAVAKLLASSISPR